jgi:methyltransferase (TIGR00027 family)
MRPGRPSLTARWIAAQRARLGGTRPSTPSGNPAAERRLYEGMGRTFMLPGLRPTGMAERTRFIDQEVTRAIGAGLEQIVLIGAGYDGRALRFGGGVTRWIEVDFPSTQADKRQRLAALDVDQGSDVRYAGLDLITGDLGAALASAGHDNGQPSLFICEGLFAYLLLEAGAALCQTLRGRAATGSVLTANFRVAPAAGAVAGSLRRLIDAVLSVIGEARRMEFQPGDPEKLLTVTSWQIVRRATSVPDRRDGGSYLLVLAAEPG